MHMKYIICKGFEKDMSAITGIYHLDEEPINHQQNQYLMESLQKYPFDDIQRWNDEKVFLGCLSQWITPESVNEKLPFYDDQRQLSITADAIIDNRHELFELLNIRKTQRDVISDSQLILLAYEKWDEDVPKHLIGDFAFMIWDPKEEEVVWCKGLSRAVVHYIFLKIIRNLLFVQQ